MVLKCKWGKLTKPIRTASGSVRKCKLKPKSSLGISRDRKRKSKEIWEVGYRKKKRAINKKGRNIHSKTIWAGDMTEKELDRLIKKGGRKLTRAEMGEDIYVPGEKEDRRKKEWEESPKKVQNKINAYREKMGRRPYK